MQVMVQSREGSVVINRLITVAFFVDVAVSARRYGFPVQHVDHRTRPAVTADSTCVQGAGK